MLINLDQVRHRYSDRSDIIQRTFQIFLEDSSPKMESLDRAISEKDFDRAAKAAHSIANLTGCVMAHGTADRARHLQRALMEKDFESSRRVYSHLRADMNMILMIVQNELEKGRFGGEKR